MSQRDSRTVETARLTLRVPTAEDVTVLDEMHNDPEVLRYMTPVGNASGVSAAWRTVALLIGHWHLLGYGQWVMFDRAEQQAVGRVGLWNPPGWPGLEISWMVRRSHWGRGYATEAARAALRSAFVDVGAEHVISIIRPDNARSIRVAEKIGEVFERPDQLDGQPFHIYGLSRAVWAATADTPTP
jgi:RimJ/RimL family protein N-acetyltransferase